MDSARSALRDVGRRGRLELVFERRCGRTVLAYGYAEAPLRIGATHAAGDGVSLILACSGPGVFAGDTLEQSVHVKSGARVALTSQSALQVHPAASAEPARIAHAYRVDEDAELHCTWDPTIPFAGARVEQRVDIDVADGGRLFWSDALMSGRASRGEAWQFERLAHELRLRVGGRLAYLERFTLEPQRNPRSGRPHSALGNPHYLSTTIVRHPDATPRHAEALHQLMPADAGVDVIADALVLARIATGSGPEFAAARRALRRYALFDVFRRPDLVDRK